MHASSQENMQKCYERYVWGEWLQSRGSVHVLDVGGEYNDFSYADIFSEPKFEYRACEPPPRSGLGLMLEKPHHVPFDEDSIDLVISSQDFEHVEDFRNLFAEMTRIVTSDGFIFVIAPSRGLMHQQPVDGRGSCLDSCRALASYAEVHFVDCWLDDRGPGNDFVGVFSKTAYPRASREKLRRVDLQFGMNRYKRDRSPAPIFTEASGDDIEIGCGDRTRSEVLREIHTALQPRLYLEIGVRDGESLALASCPSIAIDPQPGELHPGVDGAQIYQQTSDYFFEFCVEGAIAGRPIDLAFIDGMHRFEFVLRDLMNVERHMHKSSVLVIDDIFPNHPQQASPHRESKLWTGDVWKIYHCLVERRPDLTLFPVNTFPTGLLIVANLDAHNHLLREQYNFLVSGYGQASIQGFQELILERQGARSGHDQQIIDFLRQVRQMREVAGRA